MPFYPRPFFFFDNCLQLLHALMGNCIHLSSPGGGSPKPELFTPCALPVGRTTYSKLRPLPINSQPSCGLKARAVKYITVMHLYPQTFFFLYADFTVWSPVSGLYHTCNEGPDEVRVQIHRQYSFILYLLRRKSIAVPVEDQCKLVNCLSPYLAHVPLPHQTPSFPSRTRNPIFCISPTARPFVFLGLLP